MYSPPVVSAAAVRGWSLDSAVRLAASFVEACIARSENLTSPLPMACVFEADGCAGPAPSGQKSMKGRTVGPRGGQQV